MTTTKQLIKKTFNILKPCGLMCYDRIKGKVELFDQNTKRHDKKEEKQHNRPKECHPHGEAWWWQHRAWWLVFLC